MSSEERPDPERDERRRKVLRAAQAWLKTPEAAMALAPVLGKLATMARAAAPIVAARIAAPMRAIQAALPAVLPPLVSWMAWGAAWHEWRTESPDGKLWVAFGDYIDAPTERGRLVHARGIAGLLARHARGVKRYMVAREVDELAEVAALLPLLDKQARKLDALDMPLKDLVDPSIKGSFFAVAWRQRFDLTRPRREQRGAIGYLGKVFLRELGKYLAPLCQHYAPAREAELSDFPDGGASIIFVPEPAPEAEELRAIQEHLGLSLRGFARCLGCSHTLLSLVYSGRKPLSAHLLAAARKLRETNW